METATLLIFQGVQGLQYRRRRVSEVFGSLMKLGKAAE